MALKKIIFSQVALIAICDVLSIQAALITYDLGLLDNTTDGSPFNTSITYPDAYASEFIVMDPSDDPDGDGVANVGEYAFGGDPFDFETRTVQMPEFSVVCTNVNLSYPRRNGANIYALSYFVEMTENFGFDDWETISAFTSSSDIISSEFDFVTQQFSTDGKTKGFFLVRSESDFLRDDERD